MSSSVHDYQQQKNILIFPKSPTQGLYETTLYVEKEYSINFSEQHRKFCLSLHYNGANSYLFVKVAEIKNIKAKNSEINATATLENVSKDFSVDNMKQTGFYGYIYDSSVDYDVIAVDDILDIHKYLMKKHDILVKRQYKQNVWIY